MFYKFNNIDKKYYFSLHFLYFFCSKNFYILDIEYYRNYCLEKIGVTEEFPFDKTTLVFKVYGKIFALFDIDNFESVNLKCDPEKAILLREQFNEIKPGYHMNKKHWNTVSFSNNISDNLIIQLTDDSYNLVLNSIPKKLLNSL